MRKLLLKLKLVGSFERVIYVKATFRTILVIFQQTNRFKIKKKIKYLSDKKMKISKYF